MTTDRHDYSPACVAGLEIAVFGADRNPGAPAIFVTHGRGGAMAHVFEHCRDLAALGYVAIAVEQRNHGRRLADARANGDWNPHHATDLYGVFLGTAMDIVSLLDMIPARLGLSTDRVGMTGFSLGGHATLMAMGLDTRIQVGVPVIGGGDYRRLMEVRAANNQCPPEEFHKFYPDALEATVRKYDPIHRAAAFADRPLLMLNGEADTLVPIECNRRFEAAARPFYKDSSRLSVKAYPGVSHAVPDEMWTDAKAWFTRWL